MRVHDLLIETETGTPRKFWLVFDLTPRGRPEVVEQVAAGRLEGLRGISDNRQIVLDFLGVGRDALLVMDPPAVLAQNRWLQPFRYDDPDWLVANNLAALHRLVEYTPGRPRAMAGTIRRVMDAVRRVYPDARTVEELSHSEVSIASWCENNPQGVDSVGDLADWLVAACTAVGERIGSSPLKAIRYADMLQSLDQGLRALAGTYASEGEWMVQGDTFHIPEGSSLVVSIPRPAMDLYARWKAGELPEPDRHDRRAIEITAATLAAIQDHGLDRRYRVRIIDSNRFERVKTDLMLKRAGRTVA